MRYVAAFRTYSWNETVADLAQRFFASFPSWRHVVLADSSHGDLGMPIEYQVLWHDNDASNLGIASHPPGRTHWYNVDYALYILRQAFPDADAYVTCESDLAVNLPLEDVLTDCLRRGVDAVVHELKPSSPDWHWHPNAAAAFDAPWRALCFFMMMSARAVDALWEARRAQTIAFAQGTLSVWPFCETFVPSVLMAENLTIAEIGAFAATPHLRFRPRLAADDPRANAPGSMAHSVLPRSDFYRSAIAESPPGDWFRSGSELRITLDGHPLDAFSDLLVDAFRRARDHAGLQLFLEQVSLAGIPIERSADLAFCKPALTSSTSPWSHHQEPWLDAACANGVETFHDYAFHTAKEVMPWWMVDLLGEHAIDEVHLINRAGLPHRFHRFAIQSSRDGSAWLSRYTKVDAQPVPTEDHSPLVIALSDPFVARYVKIVLLGDESLHLRRVRVFGRSLSRPTDLQRAGVETGV